MIHHSDKIADTLKKRSAKVNSFYSFCMDLLSLRFFGYREIGNFLIDCIDFLIKLLEKVQ